LQEVGDESHSFYSFSDASLSFLSLSTMTAEADESRLPKNSRGGAGGQCRWYTADLRRAGAAAADATNGSVVAQLCALDADGTATLGDGSDAERFPMFAGQFQMTVDVEGWQWSPHDGKYLEFNVTVSVPAGYKIAASGDQKPVRLSLGTNDSFILISSKVRIRN